MSTLRVHLWKEWEEHRNVVMGLVLVLPLLIAGIAWFTPVPIREEWLFQAVISLLCAMTMSLAVGGDLLARERRERSLAFLERIPAGLAGAFRAKLLLLVLTTAGAATYGYLLVPHFLGRPFLFPAADGAKLAGIVIVFAAWTFAVSSWTPHNILSKPLALLVITALVAPYALLWKWSYLAADWEILALGALLCILALVAAHNAFVHGARFARSRFHAAGRCLAIGSVCLLTTSAWAGYQIHVRSTVAPGLAGFWLNEVAVSHDGKMAFARADQSWPRWDEYEVLLHIDLETGAWQEVGRDDDEFVYIYDTDEETHQAIGWSRLIVESADGELLQAFDMQDGHTIEGFGAEDFAPLSIRYHGHAQLLEGADHTLSELYDPFLDQVFHLEDFALDFRDILVTSGRWIVENEEYEHYYLDPLTGERQLVDWPEDAGPGHVLPDGRVLLGVRASESASGVFLCDPSDGSLVEIEGLRGEVLPWGVSYTNAAFIRREAILIKTNSGTFELDPDTLEVRSIPTLPYDRFVWDQGGVACLIDSYKSLVRMDLMTGECELLFPRAGIPEE